MDKAFRKFIISRGRSFFFVNSFVFTYEGVNLNLIEYTQIMHFSGLCHLMSPSVHGKIYKIFGLPYIIEYHFEKDSAITKY